MASDVVAGQRPLTPYLGKRKIAQLRRMSSSEPPQKSILVKEDQLPRMYTLAVSDTVDQIGRCILKARHTTRGLQRQSCLDTDVILENQESNPQTFFALAAKANLQKGICEMTGSEDVTSDEKCLNNPSNAGDANDSAEKKTEATFSPKWRPHIPLLHCTDSSIDSDCSDVFMTNSVPGLQRLDSTDSKDGCNVGRFPCRIDEKRSRRRELRRSISMDSMDSMTDVDSQKFRRHRRGAICHDYDMDYVLTLCECESEIADLWIVEQQYGPFWQDYYTGLILGLRPANERRWYFVTTSLIGWVQT